ncbi:MAG: hypothetical protein WCG27_05225 [Pseudomonadota bacterium]
MKTYFPVIQFLIMTVAFTFTGCSDLFLSRTFIDEMEKDSDGFFVAGKDFNVVPGDNGNAYHSRQEIMERTPASRKEKESMDQEKMLARELAQKESALGVEEYEKYMQVKPSLETTSEQIYYLNLSSREKDSYLVSKGVKDYRPNPQSLTYGNSKSQFFLISGQEKEDQDLRVGMDKNELTRNWGRPNKVDVAGNPRNQNERWTFSSGGKAKQVYIENGVVQGWSLE